MQSTSSGRAGEIDDAGAIRDEPRVAPIAVVIEERFGVKITEVIGSTAVAA